MEILFGLFSSTKVTKLNIVIKPFKKSHCPSSPLNVCNNESVVRANWLTLKFTVDVGVIESSYIITVDELKGLLLLNCASKVSPCANISLKAKVKSW